MVNENYLKVKSKEIDKCTSVSSIWLSKAATFRYVKESCVNFFRKQLTVQHLSSTNNLMIRIEGISIKSNN